ncbi:hypothetical protein GBA52_001777 [Prunus armeniaca]|nr:hypothetical protein GBA52_001777 [Prunus armeniaca]
MNHNQNQNQNQQSSEGSRHDDDAALTEFLASLMDYTPTIPDELVEHYLAKSGFQCPDVRLIRLVAVATQKFVSEVATDALQQCKARQASVVKDKRDKQQKDKRLILTMEDLSRALRETEALDLIKNVQVQAIIGPTSSMQANFVIDIGDKAKVPIISFSATSPSLTSIRSSYFFRAAQNDSSQVKAISAIVQAFGWRRAVPVYVDNEFGEGVLPSLVDALHDVQARVPYRCAIPPMATDDQLTAALYKLMTMQTRFKGLAGGFSFVNGQLQSPVFEIVNVNGNGAREIGFWTPESGLLKKSMNSTNTNRTYSTSKSNMGPIIWPGDSTSVPKGWEIPTNEKKLRVGVPVKIGSPEFVKVVRDPSTNNTLVSGYCIDIFNAVMEKLPYAVTYDFIPFAKPDGTSAGTYNQLVDQVYLGLLKNKESVGYPKGSFVYQLLLKQGFDDLKIKAYQSPEECDDLLTKGSAKGGIAAAVDETPNLRLFIAKYCSKYTIIGPIFKTNGFAFVLPKGSALVPDVSRAILNMTDGEEMKEIENKWFGKQATCENTKSPFSDSKSLGLNSFWGLLLIAGVASSSALMISVATFLFMHRHILMTRGTSVWKRIGVMLRIFLQRDLSSHTFRNKNSGHAVEASPVSSSIGQPSPLSLSNPTGPASPFFSEQGTPVSVAIERNRVGRGQYVVIVYRSTAAYKIIYDVHSDEVSLTVVNFLRRCYLLNLDKYLGHLNTLTYRSSWRLRKQIDIIILNSLDLIKNDQVQAILGPKSSMQANFVIELGDKAQVPIISFSATSPSLTSIRSSYFFRAAQNDSSQVKAISAVVQAFGWREAVPIYIDNEYGQGVIPYLVDALQEVQARVPYRSAIPPEATDDQLVAELYKLMTMQTRVFIVHMLPSLGSRLFAKAQEMDMLDGGYVWIMASGMTNHLTTMNASVINSLQGALGVKTYVPQTKELVDFRARWKRQFQRDNPTIIDAELDVPALWAYDAAFALAMAVENVGTKNFVFEKANASTNSSTDLEYFGVSQKGPELCQSLSSTNFRGLSGDFSFVDGQLQNSVFELVNVIGNGAKTIGFWKPQSGLEKKLNLTNTNGPYSTSKSNLAPILWPGDSPSVPKGWEIPTNGKRLRVGVPVIDGFAEFVKVVPGPSANTTEVFGFCIDVFNAAMAGLPYAVTYDFIPFAKPDGTSAGSYDDLVQQVFLGGRRWLATWQVQQLQPTFSNLSDLIKNREYIGYIEGSFVHDLLIQRGVDPNKLRPYKSSDECHEFLTNGSANGGIAAAIDETPNMKLFLAKYCSKYTMIGPIFKTDGFGFVFPKGSPLVPDVSRAILNVTEGDAMKEIENKWFAGDATCSDTKPTISDSNSLGLDSFRGLFLIAGALAHVHDNRSFCMEKNQALDLIKNVEVQAILGPETSMQASFVVNLGDEAHVPIVSFSASSPSLASLRSPYFFQVTQTDSYQVKAISSIVKNFGWRHVVPIYVDNTFGEGVIPFLVDALQEVDAHVPYRSVIPPSATDEQIEKELYKLMTMQTRVFIVHMMPHLCSKLFAMANKIGMMREGYVWITTNGAGNRLRSLGPVVLSSMQGVLGVETEVPTTMELTEFKVRWKRQFQQDNPAIIDVYVDVIGLRAYDAAFALALAAEQVGDTSFGFQERNGSFSSTDLDTFKVSQYGPKLAQALSDTRFKGIAGDFSLDCGQLQSSRFQILNVNGDGVRTIAFWTPENGMVKTLSSTNTSILSTSEKYDFGPIIWPGDSLSVPKGWEIPTSGKKLKIGVPVKVGFTEFVKVTQIPSTNTTDVTGFSIDVFNAAVEVLPYALPFEFIPFENPDGTSAGTYNDLVYQVYLELQPTVTDIKDLLRNGDNVGYIENTFVCEILKQLGFDNSKLKPIKTMEACDEALSKGSAKGGIAAVVDEIPNMKLFVAKYCSKYTMIGPIFKTDGFAFVFPKHSPLVPDLSQAVLNVTEGEKIMNIENKWFSQESKCEDKSTTPRVSSNSLGLESFWGLFLIAGMASILALIIFLASFLYKHRHVLKQSDSRASKWRRVRAMFEIFNDKDISSHTFKSSQQRDGIGGVGDEVKASPNSNWPESPFSYLDHTDKDFVLFEGQQTPSTTSHASPEIVPKIELDIITVQEMHTTPVPDRLA